MKRPLLWPLLGLLLGIISTRYFSFSNLFLFVFILISVFFLCVASLRSWKSVLKASLLCSFFCFGYWTCQQELQHIKQDSNLLSFVKEEKLYWGGKISENCQATEEGGRYVVETWGFKEGDRIIPAKGKLLLSVRGEGACDFSKGDLIQSYSKIKAPDFFRNRFAFDYPFYLQTQGITATSFVESKEYIVKRGEDISRLENLFKHFRQKASEQIDLMGDPKSKLVLKALLLGTSQKLDQELQDLFRKTGTTHLLVVSGLHLAMLTGFLYFLFRFLFSLYPPLLLRVSIRYLSFFSALPFVVFYSFLVGLTPSVLRSLLAILLIGFLLLRRHRQDALSFLFLIAFGILFVSPLMLFNVSFQLSFLSILSILVFVPRMQAWIEKKWPLFSEKKIYRYFLQIVLVSIAVQAGLFPLLVNTFHQVSFVGPFANLILIPYFSFLLMPLGMLALLFSPLWAQGSHFFFSLGTVLIKGALLFLKWGSSFSWSAVWLPRMNEIQILFYLVLLAVCLISFQRKLKASLVVLCVLCNLLAWFYPRWSDARNQNLRLSFLDVGQGDAVLIEFPHHQKMLVDAGGLLGSSFDIGEKVLIPTLLGRGIAHLDYLVLTHPHPDHFGGMNALVNVFSPREFWWNGEKMNSPDFQALLETLAQNKVKVLQKNSSSSPLEIEGVKVKFLHPEADTFFPDKADGTTLNNHSLVMVLENRDFSVLLTGDIQKEGEEELLNKENFGPFDLLKVPHHGSQTSSTQAFLEKVQPTWAMIEVGRHNHFSFPRSEVLDRYEKMNTKIYRSDQNGEVDFAWDGSKLKITCNEACE